MDIKKFLESYIDRNSDEHMYIQLYKITKNMIDKGEIKPDEKLPPVRKISELLDVNISTVINAYKLLEKNHYVYSRAGSGTYVINKNSSKPIMGSNTYLFNILGKSKADIKTQQINFSDSIPENELFPIDDFKCVLNEILDRDGGEAFNYTEIKGYINLRESLKDFINKDGIECSVENIQVISGAQQGIDIIAKALIDFGDVIFVEKPTYTGAIGVFKSRGANIISIPIGIDGIDLKELSKQLKYVTPKFIYIMTNFQNPTGYTYSDYNKENLLYLAEKHDFYIIEDDYLSELYYSGNKPKLLKSIDKNNRVIYIKSFSKIIMPGIRVGFLIAPDLVQNRIMTAKHLTDISTSGFVQRIFDLYIRKEMLDRYIDLLRNKYYERYKIMINLLDSKLGSVNYYKPKGGLYIWLKMQEGLSSNQLYTQCLLDNVLISPGSLFLVEDMDSSYFRLSFTSLDQNNMEKGIDILASNIKRLTNNY